MYRRKRIGSPVLTTERMVGQHSVVLLGNACRGRAAESNEPHNRVEVAGPFLVEKPARRKADEAGPGHASFSGKAI